MNNYALQAALRFLDSWLGYRARQLDLPGFSVAIHAGGDVVLAKAYGVADLETKQPLTPQTIFGVASLSKMFTATAVLQLDERRALRLDEPAATYLPWLMEHRDARVHAITVRQLLSHRAGLIRDGLDTDFWQLKKPYPTDAEVRTMVLEADLALEPNTEPKYSNLGYALLGQVVAAVSGQSHTTYITERIIRPLGLKNTFADYAPELDSRLPTAYGLPFERQRPPVRLRESTGAFASVVGVHSTAADMCRFAAAHFHGDTRLLGEAAKKEAQRMQSLAVGYDDGWSVGLGLEMYQINNRRVLGHGGHVAGYMTATLFDPTDKLAVSVMAGSRDTPSTQIVRGIFEALDWFNEHAGQPAPASVQRLNVRLCSDFAALEVVAAHDAIALIDPDDWEPFTFAETCEQIAPGVLRVTTPGSVFNIGELLHYTPARGKVRSVRYAGSTLLPEALYRQRH